MKKAAFTLLEVLVVITIVGVLTSILILNFQGVREKQGLALLADKSLALLQQTKAEVSSGKVEADASGERRFVCEGALFEVGAQPKLVTVPSSEAETCDFSQLRFENYGLDAGSVYVGSIELGSETPDAILALFIPPSGDLVLYNETGSSTYEGEAQIRFESDTYSVEDGATSLVLQLSQDTGFAQIIHDSDAE